MIANKHEVRDTQKAQHINKTRGTQNKNKIRGRTEIQQYQKKVKTGTQKLTHTHESQNQKSSEIQTGAKIQKSKS